jgi:hypothetical protein
MDFVKNYFNKIEIRNVKNMGRGVFAKEFIKKDSLIIIEKALAYAKADSEIGYELLNDSYSDIS